MIKKPLKPNPATERTSPIRKDSSKPAPGDYKDSEAFSKTQLTNFRFGVPKGKITSFVEDYKKRKNFLPGIGLYDIKNSALDIITRSSPLNRTMRH